MKKTHLKVLRFEDDEDGRAQYAMLMDGWNLPVLNPAEHRDPRGFRDQIREDSRISKALGAIGMPDDRQKEYAEGKPRRVLQTGGGEVHLEPHQVKRLIEIVPTVGWKGFMREALNELLTWLENLPDVKEPEPASDNLAQADKAPAGV